MLKSPTKVLHIIDSLNIGGAEQAMYLLVRHMNPERFHCRVFALREMGPLAEELRSTAMLANESSGSNLAVQLKDLRRYLQLERPAIVHTHLNYSDFFAGFLARVMGVPIVLSYKASILRTHARRQNVFDLFTRIGCRYNDAVVVLSHALRSYLIEHRLVPPHKIKTVYYGVDLSEPEGAMVTRGDLGLAEGPIVLLVARLEPRKDHRTFLQAAKLLQNRIPHVQFLLVGDGDPIHRRRLEDLAMPLRGAVKFLGWRLDVKRLMQISDLVVLSSRTEGLGLVLLEAMAQRKPVVATRVGGVPEIVVEGETGFLVSSGNPQALASAMGQVLEDPTLLLKLGEAGRCRVEKKFTIQRMAQEIECLYDQLLFSRAETMPKDNSVNQGYVDF